jgi:outer membrane lipase/esterase
MLTRPISRPISRSITRSATPLLAAAALLLAAAAPASAQYTDLRVFGDSLSDGGNNNLAFFGLTGPNPDSPTFIPSLPYANGIPGVLPTYSNGPVWVNAFAAGLGLPLTAAPSLAGGGNNAFGGARTTVDGTFPPGFPPSVQTQLSGYLTGNAVSPTALYVIAVGGNDVRDVGTAVAGGADLVSTTLAAANAYATAVSGMVGTLRGAGAAHVVVWNVPDVGRTPSAGSGVGPAAAAASFISGTFNSFLATALAGSGATIFDTFGLINTIVADPSAYGFGNVTQACGFAGNACDPATALFWDGIHPTAFAQGVIAQQMLTAVPEPGAVWLFMAGLAGMGVIARRRRA